MIEIKNLVKKFGENPVLKGIDLTIEEGKVIAILGPSGTGKSTLLRCVNLLEQPNEGTINLNGFQADYANLNKKDVKELRLRTAMVFQNSNLYRNKTALENITEPLTVVRHIPQKEAITKAEQLLDRVGLLHKKDAYPETLSGGERQRIGIARAMAVEADIMLFDEPTSALDPELVNEVLEVIRDLAQQKTTMMIVTHELKFAQEVADEIVFMEGGHIVEHSPAREFFNHPREERSKDFISRHMQNFSTINFDRDTSRVNTRSVKWQGISEGNPLYPMSIADMEFETPPSILKRISDRVSEELFGYDYLSDEYYEAIQSYLKRRHHYDVAKEKIAFLPETMGGLSVTLQQFTKPGAGVIITSPVYGNFFDTIEGAGRKVVECPLAVINDEYTLDWDRLESMVDEDTQAFLLCNPQNPTGTIWSRQDLEAVCKFCMKHELLLISDEVHFEFIFNGKEHIMTARVAEDYDIQCATIISVGKSFNAAGLQAGSMIFKDSAMRAAFEQKIHEMHYPFPHAFVEPVTIGAYMESDDWIDALLVYLDQNRRLVFGFFKEHLPKIKIYQTDATYLVWLDCRSMGLSEEELEQFWREECLLELTQGHDFGADYELYRRMNIANSREKMVKVLDRIKAAYEKRGL